MHDGLHDVFTQAINRAAIVPQTLQDETDRIAGGPGRLEAVFIQQLGSMDCYGTQAKGKPPLQCDADDSQSIAPKSERIFGAGWDEANAEKSKDRIKPVGQGQDFAGHRSRGLSLHRRGEILFGDRPTDRVCFPIVLGIFPTHDALKYGKLAHDACGQIGLAEFSRPRASTTGLIVKGKHASKPARQLSDPLLFLVQRAEFLVEDHALQLLDPLGQPDLPVLVEEELRIGQAGRQDPLIAFANQVHVGQLHVGDRDELREQGAIPPHDREKPLVFLHRGHENGFREREVLLVERAEDCMGILDGVHGLLQQLLVPVHLSPHRLRQALNLGKNHLAALVLVGDDAVALQPMYVRLQVRHSNALLGTCSTGTEKTMAPGSVLCPYASHLKLDGLASILCQNPADGAREPHAGLVPAHGLWKR